MSDTQMVHVKLPRAMYRAVNRIKQSHNKTTSAILREALALFIYNEIGEVVEPTVPWGGWREQPEKKQDED